jgi:hypothetical protein
MRTKYLPIMSQELLLHSFGFYVPWGACRHWGMALLILFQSLVRDCTFRIQSVSRLNEIIPATASWTHGTRKSSMFQSRMLTPSLPRFSKISACFGALSWVLLSRWFCLHLLYCALQCIVLYCCWRLVLIILWHADPLLGNDSKTNN